MAALRSRLSLLTGMGGAPSVTTRAGFSATSREPSTSALGRGRHRIGPRVDGRAFPGCREIGLEACTPPSPEPSRRDDWLLGTGRGARPCPALARSGSYASPILATLDGGAARGYVDIPQMESAVAVHLCLQNAATWRNCPRLPSKACKLTAALAAKAYSAVGQAPRLDCSATLSRTVPSISRQYRSRQRRSSTSCHGGMPR